MSKEFNTDIPASISPYLNEIAERLWAERAAVMVGAGFSKNAGCGFPDWNQLGDLFYQKAHGVKPDPASQKFLNVLRLAEEVQAAIGRPALENLLRSIIPDLDIEPSSLHVKLLELPWADVFTTNYDTLLERASAKVVTRRYEPVVNKEDLPYAIKPRIVKLHGSFPSERPFIITEEDYRRYPHDYAPFVNTVQQSLLENTFCLIGFSGDDPNFLQWTGWIRDNLGGDKAQKIYLVGVFDLSSARRQLLEKRGIIVVDLSCCQGIEKHDHKTALSRFFEYIQSKKPDGLDWPYKPKTKYPAHGADRIEEIKKITEVWRQQRRSYPGWLVLPHDNREKLWVYTLGWVDYLPDIEAFPPGLDIQYAFELVWRLERCLLPVFSNLAEFYEKILEKYWPFQTESPCSNCLLRIGGGQYQDLPWNDLRQAWLAIKLAVLRFYREEGQLDKWKKAENRLKELSIHLSAEQREFLHYEGFLFSLFTLDLSNAKQRLENWRPIEEQPYWMAKRAAALAEIGLLNEAETIVRDALERVRTKLNQKVCTSDQTLVSLESNAMLLGKYIQDAAAPEMFLFGSHSDTKTQLNERWNELKGFKCDPWNELNLFKLTLKHPTVQEKIVTEKREFDIGRVSQTLSYISSDQEVLSAYAFLRFCEEVGLPFQLGPVTMAKQTVVTSLECISRDSSFWAFATMVRLGDAKAVDSLFSREFVYRRTSNEADQLIQSYLNALNKCQNDIHTGNAFNNDTYGVRLSQVLPEVMSRLCCKCSNDMRGLLLVFIIKLYASPDKRNYRNVRNLIERLMSSMSEVEKYNSIPDLLKISFPEDLDLIVKDEFPNPFSLLEINQKPRSALVLEIQPGILDKLLQQAVSTNKDGRRWAVTSLVTLHKLQILNEDQRNKLGDALWQVVDEYGLPGGTDFYKFAFLSLPHPNSVNPVLLFKQYVSNASFPMQGNKEDRAVGITGGHIPIVDEIIRAARTGIDIWTEKDVVEILARVLIWWNADKEILKEKESVFTRSSFILNEFRSRFSRILELIAEVIGPKLHADSSDDIKTSLARLLREMQENDLPVLEAEAACFHIFPEKGGDVCNRINEALISHQNEIEVDGLKAIAKIIIGGSDTNTIPLEPNPALMFSQYLTWCSTNAIDVALWIVIRILEKKPASFSPSLEKATKRRLDRLSSETRYDEDSQLFNFDTKLEIRRIAAILGATLWAHYKSLGLSIPRTVREWHESCLSPNEFSEIRNAWEDNA